MRINEAIMQYGLYRHHNRKPLFTNIHYGCNEWDAIHITTSGYMTGYEIKLSKSDFKADFKKDRHYLLENRLPKHPKIKYRGLGLLPKYFYYVINGFDLDLSEVPDYAGLIIMDDHVFPEFVKKAPVLWKEKITDKQMRSLYEIMGKRYIYQTADRNREMYNRMKEELQEEIY